jgi:hypothetical protein
MSEPKIKSVRVYGPVGEFGEIEAYDVGYGDVTEIRKVGRPSHYCDVPYIEVWKGDDLYAEFCQHNVAAVYFEGSA